MTFQEQLRMSTQRPELTPPPLRIRRLSLDARGFPIPWFVPTIKGVPEFRAMDPQKFARAIKERRCWVCGDRFYGFERYAFPVGPMCGVNRTSSEPPSHLECAEWSVKNCPFLSRPHMRRREDAFTASCEPHTAGFAIKRNPGVILIWITTSYEPFRTPAGGSGWLIKMGPAQRVQFFAEGRPATRDEVIASVTSGLPALEEMARQDPNAAIAQHELRQAVERFARFYPAEVVPFTK